MVDQLCPLPFPGPYVNSAWVLIHPELQRNMVYIRGQSSAVNNINSIDGRVVDVSPQTITVNVEEWDLVPGTTG